MYGGARLFQQSAIVSRHPANEVGVNADSIVWKNGKGRDVLHEIQIRGAPA